MNKKSAIIISILVAVIIVLIIALICTVCCIKKSEKEIAGEEVGQVENEFEPLYISLDSDMVADIYERVNITPHYVFHKFDGNELNLDNISADEINTAAYYYGDLEKRIEQMNPITSKNGYDGKLATMFMDSAVNKMFGQITYNYANVYYMQDNAYILRYNEEDNVYYKISGFGGANAPTKYSVITEVVEYEDRYEVKEKFLFGHSYPMEEYSVKNYDGDEIAKYNKEQIDAMESTVIGYASSDIDKKILSTHIDDAYEYKHTFTKNSDGTYTWLKTEKLN